MKLLVALCLLGLAVSIEARVTATQAPVSTQITSLSDKVYKHKYIKKLTKSIPETGERI
jgi:hypothetical protein